MKKLLITAVLFFSVLNSGCMFKQANNEMTLGTKLGNTNGNAQNVSYVITDGELTYYANNEDHDHLYVNDSENNKECLDGSKFAYNFNLIDGKLYYLTSSPGKVKVLDTKTRKIKKVINDIATNLIVTDKYIFYILASEDDRWGRLYYTDLNGRHKKMVTERAVEFALDLSDNAVYYTDKDSGAIKKYDFSNGRIDDIYNGYCFYVDCDDNYIYFSNEEQKICSINKKTSELFYITEDKSNCQNIYNGVVYYSNANDNGCLYSVKVDGTEKKKLTNSNSVRIVTDGSKVYYYLLGSDNINNEYSYIDIEE